MYVAVQDMSFSPGKAGCVQQQCARRAMEECMAVRLQIKLRTNEINHTQRHLVFIFLVGKFL